MFFFFFSSRRRHTRFKCDWSSDVCSSDLPRICPGVRRKASAAASLLDEKIVAHVSAADILTISRRLKSLMKYVPIGPSEEFSQGKIRFYGDTATAEFNAQTRIGTMP